MQLNSLLNMTIHKQDIYNVNNWIQVYKKIPKSLIDQIQKSTPNIAKQNHSTSIYVTGDKQPEYYDGLIEHKAVNQLFVYTADCIPIIGCNGQHRFILHVGWQGLYDGIIHKLMNHACISGKYDIWFAPHISKDNFTVQEDFIDKWASKPRFFEFLDNNKFNLAGYAAWELKPITNMLYPSIECTFHNKTFASYRRDKTEKRNLTVVNTNFAKKK